MLMIVNIVSLLSFVNIMLDGSWDIHHASTGKQLHEIIHEALAAFHRGREQSGLRAALVLSVDKVNHGSPSRCGTPPEDRGFRGALGR
jgi:hypothetical protein